MSTDSDDDVTVAIARLVARCLRDVDEHPAQWAEHVRTLRDGMSKLDWGHRPPRWPG